MPAEVKRGRKASSLSAANSLKRRLEQMAQLTFFPGTTVRESRRRALASRAGFRIESVRSNVYFRNISGRGNTLAEYAARTKEKLADSLCRQRDH